MSDKPIYCRGCFKSNTWEHIEKSDIKDVTGKVIWEHWKCKICGETIIVIA
jgi:hypothetical protein